MTAAFPQSAKTIYVEWPIKEGGIQAAAWTDKNGIPFLAVKTLNRIGRTTGIYDWERADTLVSDRIVGFIGDRPLVVQITVNVTSYGIELIVRPPSDIASNCPFEERFTAPWGSGEPAVSITIVPTLDHYAVRSFPTNL